MLNLRSILSLALLLIIGVVAVVGCSTPGDSPPAASSQTGDDWKEGLDSNVVAALAQLSDADRQAALAQDVCPVTDKKLGSMGKPPKVTVDDQDVFLCCAGCEEELKSDPATYLAKLNKAE